MSGPTLQLIILGSMFVFSWLMVRLVRFTKTKKINTELWCTIFEGLTQGAIRLDDLKAPEEVIEKKIKRDGQDKDPFDLNDIETRISQQIAGEGRDSFTLSLLGTLLCVTLLTIFDCLPDNWGDLAGVDAPR